MSDPVKCFYEFGPFRLNVEEGQLWRDSEEIPLTQKAFKVLTLLVENGGHVLDKNELMEKIWPNAFVEENSPAVRPRRETLEGRVVLVQPLDPLVHGDTLYEGTHAGHREELWRYLPEGPFPDRSTFDTYLKRASISEDPLFFAIVEKSSGVAAGHGCIPAHRGRP